jgi:glyoxylase-like metal-dependent hydrolase (beta-lactamase superfamily II)
MRFGAFDVCSLHTGTFALDGGALFGVVPRPLWSRFHPPDEHNRVTLALRCLLVRRDDRVLLIDTGMADDGPEHLRERYVLRNQGGLTGALARAGVRPEDVTDVVVSHLQIDHAGGATVREGERFRPRFPNATVHVQRRQWAWAQRPTERDAGSYDVAAFRCLETSHHLHLLNGPTELVEGMRILISEGHTIGQQLVLLDGGGDGKLVFTADMIPTTTHVRVPYIMAYDLYPLTTLEEKKLLLAQALEEDWILVLDHDPEVPACRLQEGPQGVEVGPAVDGWVEHRR